MSRAIEVVLNAMCRGEAFGVPANYCYNNGVVRIGVDELVKLVGEVRALRESLSELDLVLPAPERLQDGAQWYPVASGMGNPECADVQLDDKTPQEPAGLPGRPDASVPDASVAGDGIASVQSVDSRGHGSNDAAPEHVGTPLLRKIARGPVQIRIGNDKVDWGSEAGRRLDEARREEPEQEQFVHATHCGRTNVITTPRRQFIRVPDSCPLGGLQCGQQIRIENTESTSGLIVHDDALGSCAEGTSLAKGTGTDLLF